MLARPSLALLLLALAGCGAPAPEPGRNRMVELLRLEDTRAASTDLGWDSLLRDPRPTIRARTARAIGRSRDPKFLDAVVQALERDRERDPAVREELLFALGQLGAAEARVPLLRSLFDESEPHLRARAAEALGKLGQDPAVLERLCDQLAPAQDGRVIGAALLALTRMYGRRAIREGKPALEAGPGGLVRERTVPLLAHPNPDVRWKAAYALADLDLPETTPVLLQVVRGEAGVAFLDAALRDRAVVARLFAARALTRRATKGEVDEAALRGLLPAAKDPHLAASLALLVGASAAPVSSAAQDELIAASRRKERPWDHHVRAAALQGLTDLCLPPGADLAAPGSRSVAVEPAVEVALRERLFDESATVRGAALVALARLDPERARADVEAMAGRADPLDRVSAATAAALLVPGDAGPLLERLCRDDDPRVSWQALDGLSRAEPSAERVRAVAREALQHRDMAVQSGAVSILGTRGLPEDAFDLGRAFEAARGGELVELRTEMVRAAAALVRRTRFLPRAPFAPPHPGELRAALVLERALADPAPAVRKVAAEELAKLGGAKPEAPDGPPLSSTVEVSPGEDLLRAGGPILVELETTKGRLLLELFPEAAPRHVKSMVALARRGFYDGLRFHRVVTGFVVQGLDPRGDGWGSGGVVLRDEIAPVPYDTGTLGMPNGGPDTGGCQVFVTHIPTPHLEGTYTVFGRLREGLDVLDAIEVGDTCRKVRVLESAPPED